MAGLIAGLFIGGLVLAGLGARNILVSPDCANLGPQECTLEQEIALEMGRRQVLFGGALALMGLAVFMFARQRSRT